MVRLYRVVLPVSDIERATAFYGQLLSQAGERVSAGRHYFDCGGVILACFDPRADGDGIDASPNPEHIYLAIEDLDSAYDIAKNLPCLEIEPEIKIRPWGERSFYARDPFGNPICLVDQRTIFTGSIPK